MIGLFCKLLIGHALGDYPLQGDFLARAKNHRNPLPGVPFYEALAAHAAIQAGIVWAITGSGLLGFLEFGAHWMIDFAKSCELSHHARVNANNYDLDQFAHVLCKALWVALMLGGWA